VNFEFVGTCFDLCKSVSDPLFSMVGGSCMQFRVEGILPNREVRPSFGALAAELSRELMVMEIE
jgi:hypothetical protein